MEWIYNQHYNSHKHKSGKNLFHIFIVKNFIIINIYIFFIIKNLLLLK